MYIGIDLGTCNTLCATLNLDGIPVMVPDGSFREYQHTPSVVLIDGRQALVGAMAEMSEEAYPGRLGIRYMKRAFGQGRPLHLEKEGKEWFAESLTALILKKIRFDAELYGMQSVDGAVVTVPAHYNDAQRRSVLEAAKLADLPLLGILDEPVAAALHYSAQTVINDQLILIYDLGGGTFDLTLLTRSGNTIHVLAKDGISNLGGKEFDELLMEDILHQYQQAFGVMPDLNAHVLNRLSRTAEQLKINASLSAAPPWQYRWIGLGNKGLFEYTFSEVAFQEKLKPKMDLMAQVLERCLKGLGITIDMLHKVILVGGGAKLPYLRKYLEQQFYDLRGKIEQYEPLQAIAKGAALHAANLHNGSGGLELKTVSTYNIAIDRQQSNLQQQGTTTGRYDKMILKNTPLPITTQRSIPFVSDGKERLRLQLVQFWEDQGEIFNLGTLVAGPFEASSAQLTFDLYLENRTNGTIGIKLLRNGQDVPLAFRRENTGKPYLFEEQKKLVDGIIVNNVF